ncbi:MAG: hypothetical protein H0W90_09750 [Actinobacteria bacterium]|nr:hypothetical protein [Actinomycetota bacterium]
MNVARERAPRSWVVEAHLDGRGSVGPALTVFADAEIPASSSSDACSLIFDGRIDNRAELASIAALRGPTDDDAELLRLAYEQLGQLLFRKLKGIFAVVVWDARHETLVAARDPVGVIPLFYTPASGAMLLSNSIEALLRYPRVAQSVNRLSLAGHVLELWPRASETLFEAVRRVMPGTTIRCRDRRCESWRYWDPAAGEEAAPIGAEDSLKRFEELLAQALDRCLACGPAGIFLSGGLDSATVAAAAAERSRANGLPPPWALSLVYPDPSLNEEKMQRCIATELGLPQVLLPFEQAVGSSGLLIASLKAAGRSSAPALNLWRPAYETLIDEGVARGCAVILAGEGGDEWLVPHPFYAADRLAALDFAGLYGFLSARQRSTPFGWGSTLRTVLWEWAARPLLRQAAGKALHAWSPSAMRSHRSRSLSAVLPEWFAPDPEIRSALVRVATDAVADPAPLALYERATRRLAQHARLGLLMEEWFDDGRQRGVAVLEPLLDADLLQFLYCVPRHVLLQGGQTKWLARATLERRLPSLVPRWPKPVYAHPFWLSLMAREGPTAWRWLGGVPTLGELGVVDPQRFARAVERAFVSDSFSTVTRIWSVWALEAWIRPRL